MSGGRAYWDGVARDWGRAGRQALWRAHADRVSRDLLVRWLPAERVSRVLKTDLFDEAFGDGTVDLLGERAAQVIGIDLSVEVGRRAASRHSSVFAAGADVRRLPFRAGTFDAVVSLSTLDHFDAGDDIAWSLAEIHRVLRPGGVLVVTLDNPLNPAVALRRRLPFGLLNRLGLVPYRGGATLGPAALRRSLAACGFEVAEVRAALHCPRAPAVALAGWLGRWAPAGVRAGFLRLLLAFEGLAGAPTRFRTGHFVAVRAIRR